MDVDISIKNFEEFLIGKRAFTINPPTNVETLKESEISAYSKIKRKKTIDAYKDKEALKLVRYIVNNILSWTPQDAADYMTKEVFEKTHLDKVSRYVIYPKDIDPEKNYSYLIKKAFPKEVNYDQNKESKQLYKRIQDGEIKKFPKKVFYDDYGIFKLQSLLNDYISKNIPSSSIEDLYKIFSNRAKANKMMKEANLYYAYKDFYDTPLEYLHESLGEYQDDFLFGYYQLKESIKEVKKIRKDFT